MYTYVYLLYNKNILHANLKTMYKLTTYRIQNYSFFWGNIFQAPIVYLNQIKPKSFPI